MNPRDVNPEETGPRAGSESSPTRSDPLGPVEIPSELEIAIKAYEPEPGVTLSGFPELRSHILDMADRPSDEVLEAWLDKQRSLIEEALPVMRRVSEIIQESVTGDAPLPVWVEGDWFSTLRNPWAQDFELALEKAKEDIA